MELTRKAHLLDIFLRERVCVDGLGMQSESKREIQSEFFNLMP